jgi:peroxiredoxin Q/BCP
MEYIMKLLVAAIAATTILAVAAYAFDQPVKVGDKAPEFKLKGSDGKEYSLSQFKGKQPVVIAWFPKAFTGG